jgi:hypothetical protein
MFREFGAVPAMKVVGVSGADGIRVAAAASDLGADAAAIAGVLSITRRTVRAVAPGRDSSRDDGTLGGLQRRPGALRKRHSKS